MEDVEAVYELKRILTHLNSMESFLDITLNPPSLSKNLLNPKYVDRIEKLEKARQDTTHWIHRWEKLSKTYRLKRDSRKEVIKS